MPERLVSDVLTKPDAALEMTLRPSVFAEFTGQASADPVTAVGGKEVFD